MLQQILRDLYVDPVILSGLDEQQKQTLFCKMREEQVRRWRMWDEKQRDDAPKTSRKSKKSVSFLKASDGEPWVWVMGEHQNDKSIEEILKEETLEKARKLAEREAEELRKHVEAELKYIEMTPKIEDMTPQIQEDIYCSVDELREKINKPPMVINKNINNYTLTHYQNNKMKFNNVMDKRGVLSNQKVSQKVALWEKRLTEERTCEILQKINRKRMEAAREAEEAEIKQEILWKEQERKAKEAELQIREIARRAREEHRLTSCKLELDSAYSAVATGVPPTRQAVLDWYKSSEVPRRAGLDVQGNVESWFHGLITRAEAERLLQERSDGSFLVRLSEKVWGYAISYRATDKCKHYLINAGQSYSFAGSNQIEHKTLGDLIEYHRSCPLSGGEKLQEACPKAKDASRVSDLFG
ncbi:PREDICTED: SH2 domain-containing protein 4A-like isoform X1 [Nicrophorus vespilloides]|uniref:SH2 domain-containing protein 4A-like isoform X1 n=1 Tax=Nicrophorus vespilloides TaxID=110193 RepID=A0ABM1M9Q6_NICVS|nr:PREDICTED: SH2 domain-containing protein 4A-like isoform X1 [Nicrophorus vespilloides]